MERAEKSGFALEAQRKIHGKYDAELGEQLLKWVKRVTGLELDTCGEVDNFIGTLKDGVVLCSYANSHTGANYWGIL
jgi:hypothetical protein